MARKRARFARKGPLIPVVYVERLTILDQWAAEHGHYEIRGQCIPWTMLRVHTADIPVDELPQFEVQSLLSSHWKAQDIEHRSGPESLDAQRHAFREHFFQDIYARRYGAWYD